MTSLRRVRLLSLVLVTAAVVRATSAQEMPKQEPPVSDPSKESPAAGKPHNNDSLHAHDFWDKENAWLFAGVGAARTMDYFSTLNMRRRGRQEILLTNEVVDNHVAFATVEAATTAVSIRASYLFHRYKHHKLERWTSFLHIGLATTGAVRNYCLQTAHPAGVP